MSEKKTNSESPARPQPAEAREQPPPEKLTKMEMVRRALAALGNDATPREIRVYVKQTYDVDRMLGHLSTCKGELRRAAAEKQTAEGTPDLAVESMSVTYQAIVAKGRNEGIEIGRLAEARDILLRQGKKRFKKAAPARVRKQLETITERPQLEELTERILDAESWEELVPPAKKK